MNSKGGLFSFGFKAILFIISLVLLAYGYYGYYFVPSHSVGPFGPPCPLGHESSTSYFGFSMGTGPCKYSRTSLIIGLVLMLILVIWTFFPKKKKK